MTTKDRNNWLLVFIIGIILLIIYWNYLNNQEVVYSGGNDNEENKRKKRIDNLNKEKEILFGHQKKNLDLEQKINNQSQKLWQKFIRILILMFIGLNAIYFLIFKAFSLENVITLYSIIIGILNVFCLFLFYKLFSIKQFVFINLKEYSYKIVAGHRDAEYYATRNESIRDRIAQIDLEINQLTQ